MARSARDGERGAAVVEFALVATLLTVLFLGVIQVGLALYVRNTLVACASAGARYGADANREPSQGAAQAQLMIRRSLSARYASSVTSGVEYSGGAEVVYVTVRAPLPVIGLVGPAGAMTVRGHALREGAP